MRTQGQDRFTGQADWKAGRVSSAAEEVIAAIKRGRATIATSKAPEFPFSTCVECGRKIPAGSMQRCELSSGGFCSWRVPAAVRDFMETALLSNSQNKPTYSLAVTYLIGAVILVCMGLGVYLGVVYGY